MKYTSVRWAKVFGSISAALVLTTVFRAAFADGPPIPSEAYVACESKKAGEACSVEFRELKLEGTCTLDPSGDRLFCRPNNMPAGRPGASDGR